MGFIWIILIIVGIYFFYNNNHSVNKFMKKQSADDIIKERFANGEIDEETYMKMKDALRK